MLYRITSSFDTKNGTLFIAKKQEIVNLFLAKARNKCTIILFFWITLVLIYS